VLGTLLFQLRLDWRSLAKSNHRCTSLRCTGLSGPRLAQRWTRRSREFTEGAMAKIHRPVGCAPDCPVSHRCPVPTVGCAISGRHVVEPMVTRPHRTVRCAPDSVRCAKGTKGSMVGFTRKGKESHIVYVRWCTTQQKARIAYQMEIQQFLATLGL
jgi:hypothetical protein